MEPSHNSSSTLFHNDYNGKFHHNHFDFHILQLVVIWIVVLIGLPLILLAIYALHKLVRHDHVAPVYVINLLITDLLQLCCFVVMLADQHNPTAMKVVKAIYNFAMVNSICFMVSVAMERYLVVAWPLYYHFKRPVKMSVAVSVIIWMVSLVFVLSLKLGVTSVIMHRIVIGVCLIIPFPLLIFFLIGTLKALSAASGVPSEEKRRIVGILVLVLVIYTLLFLPYIICSLDEESRYNWVFLNLSFTLVKFSPLADLILYIFMKKGATEYLLPLCCRRTDSGLAA